MSIKFYTLEISVQLNPVFALANTYVFSGFTGKIAPNRQRIWLHKTQIPIKRVDIFKNIILADMVNMQNNTEIIFHFSRPSI